MVGGDADAGGSWRRRLVEMVEELLRSEALKALQIFVQNNDCSGKC